MAQGGRPRRTASISVVQNSTVSLENDVAARHDVLDTQDGPAAVPRPAPPRNVAAPVRLRATTQPKSAQAPMAGGTAPPIIG